MHAECGEDGGVDGGGGELEVGLEAEGFEEGVEGAEEWGLAEPAAEDGGGGPLGGAGGSAEGAEESGLGVGGFGDSRHKRLL
jgi:hypothetical protein